MGALVDLLPSRPRFRIEQPDRPLDTVARVAAAYHLIGETEAALQLPGKPDSGIKILVRAAAMSLRATTGAVTAGRWLRDLAAEVEGAR